MSSNQEQNEYWNSIGGERWVLHQESLDRLVRPFGRAALHALAPALGEHVLDVGCGCGDTLMSLAEAVGASGSVTGVDLSAPMLARAKERVPNATLVVGDASLQQFARPFNAIFSRFGVMFFAQPASAFAHLRSLLRARGRIAFVCWRKSAENGWASVPAAAVRAVLPEQPLGIQDRPDAPGPFAFGDRETLEGILREAGFAAIQISAFDHEVELSSTGLADAARFALTAGPAARLLVQASEEDKQRAARAVGEALAVHMRGERVALPGAAWVVSARREA